MQDDLSIDPDWKSLNIYSPFKSPFSPSEKKGSSESVCSSGLHLCYRQPSDNSINEMPKLPHSERTAELFQDIPQHYTNQSITSSPLFPSIKAKELGIPMDEIRNTPCSLFTDEDSLYFALEKEVEEFTNEMRDIETTQTTRKPSLENPPQEKSPIKEQKKCCKCKKSMCLKLYCECFAAGESCEGCNCVGCHNLPEYENERRRAIARISKKNPAGLKRRTGIVKGVTNITKAGTGCNCSKSGCRKNYCDCFKIGIECGSSCSCEGCRNTRNPIVFTKPKISS